jgi:hypothetical protein
MATGPSLTLPLSPEAKVVRARPSNTHHQGTNLSGIGDHVARGFYGHSGRRPHLERTAVGATRQRAGEGFFVTRTAKGFIIVVWRAGHAIAFFLVTVAARSIFYG